MVSVEEILESNRALIIAEVGQAHEGSLGMAHAYIDAIASTGADAVKFQTHYASEESSSQEQWRVKFSLQDQTRFDYWRRMEFSESQWQGLAEHARRKGLHFIASPFSEFAVKVLLNAGVSAWKIASGETENPFIFKPVEDTGLPILVSTGMSSWSEIDQIHRRLMGTGSPFAILQCTTAYPCPPEKIGLNVMQEIRRRYHCLSGLSDHSGTVTPSVAAVVLGASVIEVHVAFSRLMFGPDTSSSLTIDELTQLVKAIRDVEMMLSTPVDKEAESANLAPLKTLFSQSLVFRRSMQENEVVTIADLTSRKPGTGIPSKDANKYVGMRLRQSVSELEFLRSEHFVWE
ncbi:MAG: N-acetylneuraminate synthase family protein [Pirellula sp.]|jgi:N,N'-diacetyllegionaminate synthase